MTVLWFAATARQAPWAAWLTVTIWRIAVITGTYRLVLSHTATLMHRRRSRRTAIVGRCHRRTYNATLSCRWHAVVVCIGCQRCTFLRARGALKRHRTQLDQLLYTANWKKTPKCFLSYLPQKTVNSDKIWYTLSWMTLRYSSLDIFPAHPNNVATLPCKT